MNNLIFIGDAIAPFANIIAVIVAIIGLKGYISNKISRHRLIIKDISTAAGKIVEQLRVNIYNANTELGWHAAMTYAQYYMNSKAYEIIIEQNRIIYKMLIGGIFFILLEWQGFRALAIITFLGAILIFSSDIYFLNLREKHYMDIQEALGVACAEQMDKMKVPFSQEIIS